jgi:exopolysaccharide biosynthesis polyprenyl glycosylphosphotransferase
VSHGAAPGSPTAATTDTGPGITRLGPAPAGASVRTAPTSRDVGAPAGPPDWKQRYRVRLIASDVVVVALAVTAADGLRVSLAGSLLETRSTALVETAVSLLLSAAWLALLSLYGTRDLQVLGTGTGEVRRVVDATLRVFGLLAMVAGVLGDLDAVRAHLLVSFPLGLALVVLTRWQWRRWLVRRRRTGRYSSTVVVVGEHRSAVVMARTFAKEPASGFRVVGACVPGHGRGGRRASDRLVEDDHLVPVLGDESTVAAAIVETGADTVVVTATEQLGHAGMRALAWELQALGVDLVVTPGMVDVVGQRLQIRPMASLPLVHVAEPQYEGATRVRKRLFDVVVAGTVLVLSSPLLLAAAITVKITSPGPVIYKGERIGRNGNGFPMMKFRSMVADADTKVIELVGANEGSGPLFKIKGDPRITRVGAFMRKFSVDELPQLVNVLRGEMSIVGPRPPLRREVETYSGEVHRRLLVRPGITGLWQVSGRSDLSWDESVRLDLSYVENWSMAADVAIVARTLKTVLASDGAY